MLKTFTILLTASDKLAAEGIESAVLHGMCAVADPNGEMRVDAFEGDLLWSLPDGHAVESARTEHCKMRDAKPRTWADLRPEEQSRTMRAARDYGGGFVAKLASAWNLADSTNAALIGNAFGAMLIESYGPGTHFYKDV